jgi:hypothetical protein
MRFLVAVPEKVPPPTAASPFGELEVAAPDGRLQTAVGQGEVRYACPATWALEGGAPFRYKKNWLSFHTLENSGCSPGELQALCRKILKQTRLRLSYCQSWCYTFPS